MKFLFNKTPVFFTERLQNYYFTDTIKLKETLDKHCACCPVKPQLSVAFKAAHFNEFTFYSGYKIKFKLNACMI